MNTRSYCTICHTSANDPGPRKLTQNILDKSLQHCHQTQSSSNSACCHSTSNQRWHSRRTLKRNTWACLRSNNRWSPVPCQGPTSSSCLHFGWVPMVVASRGRGSPPPGFRRRFLWRRCRKALLLTWGGKPCRHQERLGRPRLAPEALWRWPPSGRQPSRRRGHSQRARRRLMLLTVSQKTALMAMGKRWSILGRSARLTSSAKIRGLPHATTR